ncbi:hypothetical protein K9O30_01765 [Clostridium bowmanii]|uniref:hypothetical protein n=1 Tax=Clostridium bowmanii TaxID=132925 RepID=UPI001C0D1739|nr:hypothetical protein [Clostridium bowmanii]MBU3190303.1 hypothetical protein [Clostridium bowmanii]MCA1072485.1 hypothetical protein [Clostridium bowmanii]
MMIKIAHKSEAETLKDLPVEVMAKALEIATILDDSYGKDRGEKDLGGYILIAEDKEDIVSINKLIDFGYTLPEYVDSISCSNGKNYTNALMLLSSDFSISLMVPYGLVPEKLLILYGI